MSLHSLLRSLAHRNDRLYIAGQGISLIRHLDAADRQVLARLPDADFKLALLVLFAVGFGMMVEMAASSTLLQTIISEDKRS